MGFQEQLSVLKEKKVAGFSLLHLAVAGAVLFICVCIGCGGYVMSKGAGAGAGSGAGSGVFGKVCGMMKKAVPGAGAGAVPENEVVEGLISRDKKKSVSEELFGDMVIE